MKKHDEGYALVLVLVVIVVLGIVASALLGLSLRNLQSQTDSVDRMVAKYKAEGEIEIIVAQLNESESPASLQSLLGSSYTVVETDTGKQIAVTFVKVGQGNKVTAKISCTLLLTAEKIEKELEEYKITKLLSVEYSDYTITYEKLPEGGGT